ncbi:MAG: NAD-dependent epimerase/dehydratase family protein [Candidatus Dormiibacterota bacterium]
MKVAITGATGLIGRALVKSLMSDGHEVIALSRTAGMVGDVTTTVWDASTSALPRSAVEGVDTRQTRLSAMAPGLARPQ